ncbi:MAG TPA: bifunctional serine/threonine-protein kinase/formylglycine-generating enzyme family protein [Planctomycetaceae bacterium]|nr:bifunctional serine/threonine-protein kinase/formylglycine-generating enzyme family protein [Planctomycetaceae bacterium]
MPLDAGRVQAVFLAAVESKDPAGRAAILDAQCAGDDRLRQRVEALLKALDQSGELPAVPAAEFTAEWQASAVGSTIASVGKVIAGRYKLVEEIGEGGMGTVWVAEQTQPVRRRVAMKLIKPGMDSRQVLSRFEVERQALALMDHPNIAKVLDGGVTDQGCPFFVMEYVKGVPITEYCDQAKLSVDGRLGLFVQVCQAVQHAHQKGIIHRDLKPSNILVCLYDGQPVPKVIDFGLAKAMHQPLTELTVYTAHGLMVGTPLYMSPEQAEFNNLDVDTRSDIYSLGVILYELLTGTTPLDRQQFQDATWPEIVRLIKEEEPKKPSTKLSGSATLPTVAAQRSLDSAQLTRAIRGDLDWIVMKALEKERSRRYETANSLARDLQRYLADEVIDARPPSASYRLRKFVRRNRGLVVAGALVALALAGGIAGTTWGLVRAAAREEGERLALLDAERQKIKAIEAVQAERAADERATASLVGQLLKAEIREVPGIVQEIEKNRRWTDPLLRQEDALASEKSDKKLRLALALLPGDQSKIDELRDGLLRVSPSEFLVVRDALLPYKDSVAESLWNAALDPNVEAQNRFQAACALATYAPDDRRWSRLDTFVAGRLVTLEASALVAWREALRPAKGQLIDPLTAIFRDTNQDTLSRRFATETLTDYLSGRPDALFNLLADSVRFQFGVVFNKLASHKNRAVALALDELARPPSAKATEHDKEVLAKRQANAALALVRLGAPQKVWPLLRHTPDPTTRSYIIDRIAGYGVDPEIVWEQLTVESDASARAALILALGHYPQDVFTTRDRAARLSTIVEIYRNDVHPGVHGAAAWLLRHWDAQDAMKQCDQKLSTGNGEDGRHWYITHQGQTMTVIAGPVKFDMGSPPIQHQVTVNHSFAISTTEITGGQMHRFKPEYVSDLPGNDYPVIYQTWYKAAQYCRWLSEREGIPESEMCYPPIDQIKGDVTLPANYLERSGYRLPTEAEWEYASRSGSTTARFFGSSSELLPKYAWYVRNSDEHTWPVGTLMPNDFGLFDIYGNALEWCQDAYVVDYDRAPAEKLLNRFVSRANDRVLKGGSFGHPGSAIESADRSWIAPDIQTVRSGFRIARTIRSEVMAQTRHIR